LGRILEALRSVFAIAPGAEITLEVNPTAAEAVRLGPARDLGVNRLQRRMPVI
jgi:Coproporphyrinogen III oxidase and related Fe-S oxidoreductases